MAAEAGGGVRVELLDTTITKCYGTRARAFKGKRFARWEEDERNADLRVAAAEALAGRVEADLGGFLFKKRIARAGGGKSGGYRTILRFRKGADRVFFLSGFSKNDRATISPRERTAFGLVAASLVDLDEKGIGELIADGEIFELEHGS